MGVVEQRWSGTGEPCMMACTEIDLDVGYE